MSAVLTEWAVGLLIATAVFVPPAALVVAGVNHPGAPGRAVRATRTAARHAALAAALWLAPVTVHAAHHAYYMPGVRHG
jgi:hypothetical protein